MKKHSTGALTKDQRKAQEEQYAKKQNYDYVIIGSGMSALSFACLMAKKGKKICILEAHDQPGGYAHTFKIGEYYFCAQVHYIWGCAPGGAINAFLKHIGLDKDITFELLNPEGYDRMVMPDGKAIFIPNGFDKLIEHVESAYPGQRQPMIKFTNILTKIQGEIRIFPNRKIKWWEFITQGWNYLTLLQYMNKTLQDVFDDCKLSKEAQAILIANAGDMMSPPKELSIFAFTGLFCGYNTGAYYPTKHFKYYIERLVKYITDNTGHIYYETEVIKINTHDDKVTSLQTKDGKTFTGNTIICNMDPQKASYLIGRNKFPKKYIKPLSYTYAPAGVMIYLGLKNIDLKKYGFGKYNTWHLEQWDMNTMWEEQGKLNFAKPWIFMSTPTLHSKDTSTAPKGGQILEIATYAPYAPFKEKQKLSYAEYNRLKMSIADRMLDLVEEKYIPDLRKHIAVKTIGTSTTNEDFCLAPEGNAYGSLLTPKQLGLGRLKAKTPFNNFYWCNASSGNAGIHGTTCTGMNLYMDLTGDRFFERASTMDEFITKTQAKQ